MSKFKTVGQYMERRKRVEKILRIILFLLLVGVTSLFVIAIVTGDVKFLLMWMLSLFAVGIYAVPYVDRYVPFLINRKWLKRMKLLNIADDMMLAEPTLPKSKIYCEKNVIFCEKFGVVIPFEQIAWGYIYQRRVNGINVDKPINLHTKSGKRIPVYAHKKELEILLLCIVKNAPNAIFGYGKEQKKLYKSLLDGYKQKEED